MLLNFGDLAMGWQWMGEIFGMKRPYFSDGH